MEIINFNAIPMIPLDDKVEISPLMRSKIHENFKNYLVENPPLCLVGSLDKVNRKITQIDLKMKLQKTGIHSNLLGIEQLEAEKKEKEQNRILEEKEKASKTKKKTRKLAPQSTPSTISGPHPGPKKRAQKDGLAELFHAPDYNEEKPSELPNGVNYSDMVGNVIRAQENSITGKTFCAPLEMAKFFSSPYSKAIILDCFWWIFHERYEPNKEIQKKLFNRVSKNYAHLLTNTHRSPYEESILKKFSSLVSQALYTSFCTCFPQSWFDNHEFKSVICNTTTQWIAGTFPNPKSYVHWNYVELEPVRFRREELMRGREKFAGNDRQKIAMQISKSEPRSKSQRQASKKVREITERRILEKSAQRESHPACKGPEFEKNLFSLTGQSPLIVHFLQERNSVRQTGQDIFVVRKDISKTIPEGTPTYRDVIEQVKSNMRKLSNDVTYFRKVHWKEWKLFEQTQKEMNTEFNRKVKEVMAKEKKKLSQNFIPTSVVQEGLADPTGKVLTTDELLGKADYSVSSLKMKSYA
ncbi:protein FAM227A [Monodelphis domestica]|uniref:protein FAM227A n=1 Tax=Monodelphis domestica TaxID=13616 RepID=UPI0024E26C53|nr:protein FAM227A [Monodelphis domestica]XP_007503257.2 protein FAM227A [Monodelphis domestica]